MKGLPKIVGQAELVSSIVCEFAFQIAMSKMDDKHFHKLNMVELDDVYQKAYEFAGNFIDENDMINTQYHQLEEKLKKFLRTWAEIVDVTAIQQNVHSYLNFVNS